MPLPCSPSPRYAPVVGGCEPIGLAPTAAPRMTWRLTRFALWPATSRGFGQLEGACFVRASRPECAAFTSRPRGAQGVGGSIQYALSVFRMQARTFLTVLLVVGVFVVAADATAASRCGDVSRRGLFAQNIRASDLSCKKARRVSARYLSENRVPGWKVSYRDYRIKLSRGSARVRFVLVGTD